MSDRNDFLGGCGFVALLIGFLVVTFIDANVSKVPAPEMIYQVEIRDSNLLGITVPWGDKEPQVFLTREPPRKINLIGGRYGFHDLDGAWHEFKGSKEFTVEELERIPHTDPRHSRYKPEEEAQ